MKQSNKEVYTFAETTWLKTARVNRSASWDYGRLHTLPLWPEYAGHMHYLAGTFCIHSFPILTAFELPLEGVLEIRHDDRVTLVHPGEIYILPSGDPNSLGVSLGGSCRKLALGLCGHFLAPLLAGLGLSGERNLLRLTSPERLAAIIEAILPLLQQKEPESVPQLAALALQFLTELRMQQPETSHPVVAEAIRIYECGLSQNITLDFVAAELKVAPFKLIRLFRKHLDTTPKAYQLKLRMQNAEALLHNTHHSIEEIARRCGYASPRCFTREFHKHHQVSPREFRSGKNHAGFTPPELTKPI